MTHEFEFIVKVEGYKERNCWSCGHDVDEAKQFLEYELNSSGFYDIKYIIPA